jgi:hypothetical protein
MTHMYQTPNTQNILNSNDPIIIHRNENILENQKVNPFRTAF